MKVSDCAVCTAYRKRRAHVLAPAIELEAFKRGVGPMVVTVEYLFAVHRRHLAGRSLSTRTHTPDVVDGDCTTVRVKRACNGCQKSLGDVTDAELAAALAGRSLPDVRLECGCLPQGAAA